MCLKKQIVHSQNWEIHDVTTDSSQKQLWNRKDSEWNKTFKTIYGIQAFQLYVFLPLKNDSHLLETEN